MTTLLGPGPSPRRRTRRKPSSRPDPFSPWRRPGGRALSGRRRPPLGDEVVNEGGHRPLLGLGQGRGTEPGGEGITIAAGRWLVPRHLQQATVGNAQGRTEAPEDPGRGISYLGPFELLQVGS